MTGESELAELADMELPHLYEDFSLNQRLLIRSTLFHGSGRDSRCDNEIDASIGVANIGAEANGLFVLYGDDVDNGPPAGFESSSALGVRVVWAYTASDRTLRLSVTEINPSNGSYVEGASFSDYVRTFPDYTVFVPSVGFNAENVAVVPSGESNVSANKPIVTSLEIVGGTGGSNTGGGGNNFLYADDDNDGVPDVLEAIYGGNSGDGSDAAKTVGYLTDNTLFTEQQVLDMRLNSIRLSDNSDGTFTLSLDVEERPGLSEGAWNYNSSQQFIITPVNSDRNFIRLVAE